MYPHWWNKTITLYNKYTLDDKTTKYKRTILNGCSCFNDVIQSLEDKSAQRVKGYVVRIRKSEKFLQFDEWIKKNGSSSFTLNTGDIIVIGNVNDDIDEEVKGKRANDLLFKYKNRSFVVKTVKYNTDLGIKHYLAIGE